MSSRTRSLIKLIAVLLVVLAVLMQLSIIIIPALAIYKFWIVVIAFAFLLIATR